MNILLFHHAQGLTEGVHAFADELRAAGHDVTTPDLYDGRTFPTVQTGVDHLESLGVESVIDAAVKMAEALPNDLVYAGMSMGVMPAQKLAQTRPGARGALLYHSGVPLGAFGAAWPEGVPMQAHTMRDDGWGDVDELKELTAAVGGELYIYEGPAHLFTDRSTSDSDPAAAALVMERTLAFLASLA